MKRQFIEHKYDDGDIVYSKINPDEKLLVRRYIDRIYFCRHIPDLGQKELAYFERELV